MKNTEPRNGILPPVSRNRLLALEQRMLFEAAPVIADSATAPRSGSEDTHIAVSGITVSDAEGDAQHVTLNASHGTLNLGTLTGLTGVSGNGTASVSFSGSLADINAALNSLGFTGDKDYNGNASFTVSSNDSTLTSNKTVNINITPVNDAPVISGSGAALQVNEGGSANFSGAVNTADGKGFTQSNLGLTDVDNSQQQVIIKITSLASDGTLWLNGQQMGIGSSFSADQIANLSYRHNGAQVTNPSGMTDTFGITVDDGAGGVLLNQSVNVHVNPVDQAPVVSGNITVIEGEQNVSLTANGNLVSPIGTPRGAIQINDPDQAAGVDYSYSLSSLPTHGTLFYDGIAISSTSFVIHDLSKLTYSHDGSEPGASGTTDSFKLNITDDGGGTGVPKTSTAVINLTILPSDNDPVLDHSITQTLGVGQAALTVTTAMLQVKDSDSADASLTYTLNGVPDPNLGYFTLNGALLVGGSSFTQADVNAGKVVYHMRTAPTATRVDTISFTVKDGGIRLYPSTRDGGIYDTDAANSALTTNTFSVIIPIQPPIVLVPLPPGPPANTEPVVGGDHSATLNESATYVLTSTDLHSTDDATPAASLTYRLLGVPTSGSLLLNGVALGLFGTFTQDDVDNGRVTFKHNGNEQFVDNFQFSVSDGTLETAQQNFSLNIVPQNDTPTANTGTQVKTDEGGTVVINNGNIILADADSQGDASAGTPYAVTNDLVFKITSLPQYGTLTLNGVALGLNDTVTAAQLASGAFKYTHNGTEHFTDSFTLVPVDDQNVAATVGTNQSSTGTPLVVSINITPVNDAPVFDSKSQLVSGEAGAIHEGQSVVIGGASSYANADGSGAVTGVQSGAHLVYGDDDNSSIQRQYRLTAIPINGSLLLNGVVMGLGSVFTQADLDAGRVTYQHDGSETRSDSFSYVVSDGDYSANDNGAFAQGTTATASTFNIEILPTNDKPTVSGPGAPVNVDSTSAANNPVGGFVIGDPDDLGNSPDTPDVVQVIIRLTQTDGTAFSAANYAGVTLSVSLAGGATRDGDKDGNGDYLVLRGTRAQVNAALATLSASLNDPSNENHQYRIQVVVDDRLRDASGNLSGGANGGPENQAATLGGPGQPVSNVEFNAYSDSVSATDLNIAESSVLIRVSTVNEAPVLSTGGTKTVIEDVNTPITGIVVSDAESTGLDLPISVTLSIPAGQGVLGIGGAGIQTTITLPSGRTVTISGDNSSSIVLTGRADDIQSLINDPTNGLTYKTPANGNHDYNGAAPGNVTLSLQLNEGSAAVGGDTGSGSITNPTATATLAISLTASNDAPTVAAGGGNLTITQGGTPLGVPGFSVSDPDYTDGGGITSQEKDFIQVTIRLTDASGVPLSAAAYANIIIDSSSSPTEDHTSFEIDNSNTGNGAALVIRGTLANINAYLAGLRVTLSGSLANTDTSYKVQVIADDRLRDVASGVLDPSNAANGGLNPNGSGLSAVPTTVIDPYAALPSLPLNVSSNTRTLFVSSINDPAQISASNVTVSEGSSTLNLTAGVGGFVVADPDANGSNTYSATIHVSQGVISAVGGSGGTISGLNTSTITITGATQAEVTARLQALTITYPTLAGAPAGAHYNGQFTVTVSVNDGGSTGQRPGSLAGDTNDATSNPGDYDYADGISAALVTTRTITVTVTPVDDAPVSSGLSGTPTVTKGGSAVQLDSDGNVSVGDIELDISATHWAGVTLTIGRHNGANANDVFGLFDSNPGNNAIGVQISGSSLIVDGVVVGTVSNASGSLQVTFNSAADAAVVGKVMGAVTYRSTDNSPTASADVQVDFVLNDQNPNTIGGGTAGSGQDQGAGGQKSVTSSISVHLNTSPVANDDLQTAQTGVPASGNLLANDSDPDGNPLAITGFSISGVAGTFNPGDTATLAGIGTLRINADGSYLFTPNATYHGAVPVATYTVSDGQGGSDTAQLTLKVNAPPVAVDDGLQTVQQGQTASGNVLGNDSDPDGNPLNVSGFSVNGVAGNFPAGNTATIAGVGSLTVNADGSYLFTPLATYHGDVPVVTYTLADGNGGSATAHLQIRVNGTPLAADDGLNTVQQGQAASGNVLSNDSDPDGNPLTVTGFSVNGIAGSFTPGSTATIAGVGSLTVNADGSYLFTPLSSYHGDVPLVTYSVADGVGGSDTAHLSIRVNAAPQAGNDGLQTVQQGQPASGNVLGNDSDPDGNSLNVSGFTVNGVAGNFTAGSTATIAGIGNLTVNADGSYLFTPLSSYHGDVPVVTYSVTDGNGGSASAQLSIRVNGRPVTVDDGQQLVQKGQTASGNVLTNDSDPEGNPLSVSGFTINGVAGNFAPGSTATIAGVGSLTINADGSYLFTPLSTYTGTLPQVTYSVVDSLGGSASAHLDIRVNTAPLGSNDGLQTVQQGQSASGNVLGNDSDADGDTLNVSGYTVQGVAGSFLPGSTATIAGVGSLTVNADGSYLFTPTSSYHGDVPLVTYSLSDGHGATASATLSIRVNGTPIADNDGLQTVQQGHSASGNVLSNDSDPDGNPLSVSGFTINGVAGSFNPGDTATIAGVGSLTVNADGSYLFTPLATYHGDVPVVTYTLADGNGGSATAQLQIRVNGTPLAADDGLNTVQQGQAASGNVLSNDSDPDGNPLGVSGFTVNGVAGNFTAGSTATIAGVGSLTVNADGSYLFTPLSSYHGDVPVVTYSVADGVGGTDTAQLTIRVNGAPLATDDGLQTVQQGQTASGNVLGNDSDPDGNPLTVTGFSVNGVAGNFTPGSTATISGVGSLTVNADGSYLFTPLSSYHGDVPVITYSVADGVGGTDTAQLSIRVNGRPVAVDDGQQLVQKGQSASGNVLSNDSDPEGNPLSVSGFTVNGVAGNFAPGSTATIAGVGSLTINADGSYLFTPLSTYTGTLPQVTYSVADSLGGSASAHLDIRVNAAPLGSNDGLQTVQQGQSASGNVLGNDSDADGDTLNVSGYTVQGVAGSFLPGSTATIAGVGSLTVNADGSYLIIPASTFHGDVPVVTYSLSDGHGATASATLSIRVNGTPVASNDGLQTVQQGQTASGNVLSNDSDPDGNPLSVSSFTVNGVAGSFLPGNTATIAGVGTLQLNADGSYLFTPTSSYHGNVPVLTYTVSDGVGASASATLHLAVNAPPTAINDGLQAIQQGHTASGNVLSNDSDPDGNPLSISGFTVNGVPGSFNAGDTVNISGVGTLSLHADGSYLFIPTATYFGSVPVITYSVSDGQGGSASAQLHIAVNPQPTANDDTGLKTDRDTPLQSINVLGNDSDPNGFTLTVTHASSSDGSVSINPDGTLNFTPAAGFTGNATITYVIIDGHGGSDSAQVLIHVNQSPVAVNDGVVHGPQDTPLSGNVLNNDHDPESDALHVVDFTINGVSGTFAAGSSVTLAGIGTLTLGRDGSYSFVPLRGYLGAVPTLSYRISDDHGGFASANLSLFMDSTVLPLPPDADKPTVVSHHDSGGVDHYDEPRRDLNLTGIQQAMTPGLFVTFPVMNSQAEAMDRIDPRLTSYIEASSGEIRSDSIGLGLGFVPDLHVTLAVQDSQKTVDHQQGALKFKDSPYFTGGKSLFDDFDRFGSGAFDLPMPTTPEKTTSADAFSVQMQKAAAQRHPHLFSETPPAPATERTQ
ncbi:Ig-like domain-containing protein [Pseudomonas sp. NA-150]|uniref:Ig-like domain-containing protein n=1 Tax=Pseudomonas sp. NA-150 TaxID=3367525 RepID=UPI0037C740A4